MFRHLRENIVCVLVVYYIYLLFNTYNTLIKKLIIYERKYLLWILY